MRIMDGTHLINALAGVIAEHSGRTPDRVIAALSRDVDDPGMWRSHGDDDADRDELDAQRLRWQRAQTRRSRLVVRLCEELVASATGVVRTDEVLGTNLSFFQQLSSAIILHQHGHNHEGAELARRALQRASSAGESTFAVLAADIIVAMQERPDDERTNARFDTERRRWRDADHLRRRAEELLIGCLEYRRHVSDTSKERELEQARTELLVYAADSSDPVMNLCVVALEVQQLLVCRKNDEAITVLNSVTEQLTKLPSLMQWVGQWLMVSRAKAYLALGEYATVLEMIEGLNPETFHRDYLQCDISRIQTTAVMRLGQWDRARQLILQDLTHGIGSADPLDQERQMVITAYYDLGAMLGYHSEPVISATKRVTTLMNSIDLVLQDRMGLGPIMLMYEVTANLLQGKVELAERKMANLQVYSTRNLRFHGAEALRGFISLLRMVVHHKGAFTSDARRVRLFMSKITDEHESATEQMICPLPLRKLAQSLIDHTNGRLRQTSV
ncbi:MAG: hypothetical protein ACKOE4_07725 [Candidatus Kapaibacterium sp.]